MKNSINILEWNMNFASYDTTKPATFVPKYIKGFDVAILTEVRNNEHLINMINDMRDYDYICSDDQGEYSNQIIIVAKKHLRLVKVVGGLGPQYAKSHPDFLHGTIIVGEKIINILGVRIKIGYGLSYADRFEQFRAVKRYMNSLPDRSSVICCGDFNSGQIRGNVGDDYAKVRVLYKYRNNRKELSDLRLYNFHLIKEELGSGYTLKETMSEDNSWGLTEKDGVLLYGLGTRLKNDLIFYTNDIEGISRYSWDHVRKNEGEYLGMLERNCDRRGNRVDCGYPDHARLIAELFISISERVNEA